MNKIGKFESLGLNLKALSICRVCCSIDGRKLYTLVTQFILIPFLLLSSNGFSQTIVNQSKIENGRTTYCNEYMIKDSNHNYYVGLVNGTWVEGFTLADTQVNAFRQDPFELWFFLYDFYYFKYDSDFNFAGSFVIDNAQNVKDIYSTGEYNLLSMSIDEEDRDDSSHPLLLNGEIEISRDSVRGKGILITLDEEMKLVNYIIPSTGGLGQIARDGRFVYMEIIIPDGKPYILLGQDTVYNHYLGWKEMPYGFYSIVLAKYDMESNQFVWWRRIGNVGEDQLRDMIIDSEGNLIIHGNTSSGEFIFSEEDTVKNYQVEKPFLAKYNSDGSLIWHILRTEQPGDISHSIRLDSDDNIYYIGAYTVEEFAIGDTVLSNPLFMGTAPTDRAIIIKYGNDGSFKWIVQLEGEYRLSSIYDLSTHVDNSICIMSGTYYSGDVILGDSVYVDMPEENNLFLLALDSKTGFYLNHAYISGPSVGRFTDLHFDTDGILNMYYVFTADISMFSTNIYGNPGGGCLLKLDWDFISSNYHEFNNIEEILFYPNPVISGEEILLDMNNNQTDKLNYSILNTNSQIVQTGFTDQLNGKLKISLLDHTPGFYIFQVMGKGYSKAIPFIIVERK